MTLQSRLKGSRILDNVVYTTDEVLIELDRAHTEITRLIHRHNKFREEINRLSMNIRDSREKNDLESILASSPKLTSSLYEGNAISYSVRDNDFSRAQVWADVLSLRENLSISCLKSLRLFNTKLGSISKSLNYSYEILNREKNDSNSPVELLEGRVRELHGSIPRIAGNFKPIKNVIRNRVVHLVKESRPTLSNGFTSRSHNNFLAEKKAGLEPIVITEPGFPDGNLATKREYVDGVLHIRLGFGALDYSKIPVDRFNQLFADLAYEQVKLLRPEVIHVSSGRRGYDTALAGIAIKEKSGIPLFYEVRSFFEANWTDNTSVEESGEIFESRMKLEELCMSKSDRVLTICNSMKDDLINRGVPESKIGIIPNAVDISRFTPMPRNAQLAAKYKIDNFATFGYVSNMDHYRESQETLVQALAVLKKRNFSAKCVLVGGGPRITKIQSLAEELGVADCVIFTGAIDHAEIDQYYSLIDIFVVPRVAERAAKYVTPLKPFEAMAERKPLVTSDLPALMEITNAPERGLSFEAGNPESLADILITLFGDYDLRQRISEAGRAWVATKRTWDSNGSRYVAEILKLRS